MPDRPPRTAAVCLRLPLLALLLAYLNYGAIDPAQLHKNRAEVAAVSVAGLGLAIQLIAILVRCSRSVPYSIWYIVSADFVCLLTWLGALGVLGWCLGWQVYYPKEGTDPEEWLACAGEEGEVSVLTDDGVGRWIQLVWCPVLVDGGDENGGGGGGGQKRLVGNGAAIVQLKVLIGLAVGAVVLTGFLLLYVIMRGRHLGLFGVWWERKGRSRRREVGGLWKGRREGKGKGKIQGEKQEEGVKRVEESGSGQVKIKEEDREKKSMKKEGAKEEEMVNKRKKSVEGISRVEENGQATTAWGEKEMRVWGNQDDIV